MFRHLAILFTMVALVAGCKGKQTATDEQVPLANQGDSTTSTPLAFDAQGSDSGKIDGLTSINFEYDRASLSGAAKSKIQGNAAWMKKNSGVKLQIEGHCDARGSIEYNIALGERRANAVRAYMVSLGISGDRLSTISYGKDKPLTEGDSDSAYAKNRRANFVPLQ